jgi:hypothetical protein
VSPLDPEVLKTWTTAALVLHIAHYAAGNNRSDVKVVERNAQLVAAELNARLPPRVMPNGGT